MDSHTDGNALQAPPDDRAGARCREPAALAIELPAVPGSLAVVRRALTGVAEAVQVPARALDDLKVAVTEACTNVVVHAYDGRATAGPLLVDVWHRASRLVVRVSDVGTGMEPRLARRTRGLGLGLRLIATLAAEVRISTQLGKGTTVWMTFDLP